MCEALLVVLNVLQQLLRVISARLSSSEWFGEEAQKAENYLA